MDVLANFQGQVVSVIPRGRLEIRSGEVVKSITVKRDDLIQQGKRLVGILGATRPVTLQCIDTYMDIIWLEINLRFGGGVPLSIQAGVDYPFLLYQFVNGENVTTL